MKHKFSIIYIGFLLVLSCMQACSPSEPNDARTKPPNIVLIFIDDMGYADAGCFGATDYATPHIDQLAGEGMRFTNFYVSQAVCSASRASLLTGCYAERVGIQGALSPKTAVGINPDETLIPEMLKEAGYATGIFGKWHLGNLREFLPLQHGFDEYVGLPYSNDMWPVGYDGKPLEGTGKRKSQYPPLELYEGNRVIDTIATLSDQAKLTTLYTEKAIAFIENHKSEPFFLYLPHSMVHVPLAVSEKFRGKSGKGLFADVMMELDWSVGEILRTLKDNGLDENTLVIFTSDNGPWLSFGNHAGSAEPLREGKGTMWEGGPRVSTLMRWPAVIAAGVDCNQLASTIDILPTLAEITAAGLPEQEIDGISILPLLREEKGVRPRNQFCYYYGGELIAVRKDAWKLVFPHTYRTMEGMAAGKDGYPAPYGKNMLAEMELYNLESDIGEGMNLSAQYPEIVETLAKLADSVRGQLGDRLRNIKGKGVRKPGRKQQEKAAVSHLAVDKSIAVGSAYAFQYAGHGDHTLVDGLLGSYDFSDEAWLGFQGLDFNAVLDLGEPMSIQEVSVGFMIDQGSWIFSPEEVMVSLSEDGHSYQPISHLTAEARKQNEHAEIRRFESAVKNASARFVKIEAKNIGSCPEWHPGAGGKAWLFVDEIIIK